MQRNSPKPAHPSPKRHAASAAKHKAHSHPRLHLKIGSAAKGYLIAYNAISAALWSYILYSLISTLCQTHFDFRQLFQAHGFKLACIQSLAFLEIIHSFVGLVRSPLLANLLQIGGRLFVIWVPGVYGRYAEHWAFASMSIAWAIADITRYIFYIFNTLDMTPKLLLWARYSFFLILYPIGTGSELVLTYQMWKHAVNPAWYYGLLVFLIAYIPGFPWMYMHMLKQRSKALGSTKDAAPKKARVIRIV